MRKEKKSEQEKKLPSVLSLDEISVKKRHKYSEEERKEVKG